MSTSKSRKKVLGLFFTTGISMNRWVADGMFDREKLIYHKYLQNNDFQTIYWFTYGSKDLALATNLQKSKQLEKEIIICQKPKVFVGFIGDILYSLFLPFIQYKNILKCSLLKTNQATGAWTVLLASWFTLKPFIVRTGYTASLFYKRQKKPILAKVFQLVETISHLWCKAYIVASKEDLLYMRKLVGKTKLHLISNYIDTTLFAPSKKQPQPKKDLIFVGRLNEQKNLFSLISAVANTGVSLDIYGSGELRKELEHHARKVNAKVTFKGSIENKKIPTTLQKYKVYVLPSYYEGMPKTLLEAMASQMSCIGTNVPGIKELIVHKKSGYLCGADTQSLKRAIESVLHSQTLQKTLAKNARLFVQESFSLDAYYQKEKRVLAQATK